MRSTDRRVARQRGFTLLEIMIVVVILGVLGTMILPNILGRPDEARQVKARQDISAIEAALELYRLDNFNYPSADDGLQALVESPGDDAPNWKDGGYLKKLAKDPWQREYVYLNPGERSEIDIYTLGRDGAPGG
ncbi:MAG: type II secretion system major pseudopilin GspG, partial [Pseudomonadota bacterium]